MKNQELKDFIGSISKKYDLKKVIMFGSRAAGTYKEDSDIDLLVEYNTPTVSLFRTVGLIQEIEERFNLPVDIVRYPVAKRGINLRIDSEVPIYG